MPRYAVAAAPVPLGVLRLNALPPFMRTEVVAGADDDDTPHLIAVVSLTSSCYGQPDAVPVDDNTIITGSIQCCDCDECRRTLGSRGGWGTAIGRVSSALIRFRTLAGGTTGSSWRNLPQPYRSHGLYRHLRDWEETFWAPEPWAPPRPHEIDAWSRTVVAGIIEAAEGTSLAQLWAAERAEQHQLRSLLGRTVAMPTRPGPGTLWVPVFPGGDRLNLAGDPAAAPDRPTQDGGPGATVLCWRSFDTTGVATAALLAAHVWQQTTTGAAVLVPDELADAFAWALTVPGDVADLAGHLDEVDELVRLGRVSSPHARAVSAALLATTA